MPRVGRCVAVALPQGGGRRVRCLASRWALRTLGARSAISAWELRRQRFSLLAEPWHAHEPGREIRRGCTVLDLDARRALNYTQRGRLGMARAAVDRGTVRIIFLDIGEPTRPHPPLHANSTLSSLLPQTPPPPSSRRRQTEWSAATRSRTSSTTSSCGSRTFATRSRSRSRAYMPAGPLRLPSLPRLSSFELGPLTANLPRRAPPPAPTADRRRSGAVVRLAPLAGGSGRGGNGASHAGGSDHRQHAHHVR